MNLNPSDMPAFFSCACCGNEILFELCGECGTLHPNATFTQRGVRLNTGTEHAIAFSATCLGMITPDKWPTILANNRAVFEEAWALKNVPEDVRAKHRDEMATWRILGWADEISAEQALAR